MIHLQLLRKQAWRSHTELALKLRTTPLALSKLENGLYAGIPNRLHKEITAIFGDIWNERPLLSDRTRGQEDPKSVSVGKNKPEKPKPKYADLKNLPFDEKHYSKEKAECVECSTYRTPDGEPRMQVFTSPNNKFPLWTWNGKYYVCGCPDDTLKYLCRIDKLKNADVVFLEEGEKDVHSLRNQDLADRTWPGWANALKERCEKWDILGPLAGKDVFFILDNGEAGRTDFEDAQKYLFGRDVELPRIIVPGVLEGGDTSDSSEIHREDLSLRDLFLKTCLDVPLYVPDLEIKIMRLRTDLSWEISRPSPDLALGTLDKCKISAAGSVAYHAWYSILWPLEQASRRLGIAIVVVRHFTKGNSLRVFDDVMGGVALTGIPDSNIAIQEVLNVDYQAALSWQGLRSPITPELALKFYDQTMTFRLAGDVPDYDLSEVEQAILSELSKSKKPLTPKQLHESCRSSDEKFGAFSKIVQRLNAKGKICKVGYSSYTINSQTQPGQNVRPGEEEL
ncbi:MAG: hypothetical protein ACLPVO_00375 [Desulfomonilaceae bacterium]